jgi:hypothetical protein
VSTFTPEVAQQLGDWIADGGTIRSFCRLAGNPSFKTVYRWLANDKVFAAALDIDRDIGHEAIAQDALLIADEPLPPNAGKAEIAHRRLRVETRLKLLAKWHPKRYGDKITTELTGKDGGPIQTEELSDFEKARRVAFLLARGLHVQAQQPATTESQPGASGTAPQTTL